MKTHNWINTDEKLPVADTRVLFCVPFFHSGTKSFASWEAYCGCWCKEPDDDSWTTQDGDAFDRADVTHWMPIEFPEQPEEK